MLDLCEVDHPITVSYSKERTRCYGKLAAIYKVITTDANENKL